MKAVYYIHYPTDVHWMALSRRVAAQHSEMYKGCGIMTPHITYNDYNKELALYKGRFIGASLRSEAEFDYLEFDSEEDLVIFKLRFC
jgi:hypothetical protein